MNESSNPGVKFFEYVTLKEKNNWKSCVRLVFCNLEKEEKNFLWNRNSWKNTKNLHHHADTNCGTQLYRNRPPVIDSRHSCMFIGHAGCFGKKFWIHEIIFQFLFHKWSLILYAMNELYDRCNDWWFGPSCSSGQN